MQIKNLCVMLALTILLVGCTGTRTGDPKSPIEYRTGNQGLEPRLMSHLDRLYENDGGIGDDAVKMIMEIENKGAYPQPDELVNDEFRFDAYMWVGGFDDSLLSILPGRGQNSGNRLDLESLEGKSPINLDGGFSSFVFDINVYNLPDGMTVYRTPLLIDITYTYKTIASPLVCIDPDPTRMDVREKVCEISRFGSVSLKGSQGAPVAVTMVEEEVSSRYILFKIYVQNVGGGRVIPKERVFEGYDPNKGFRYDELNKVYIHDVRVGNDGIVSCNPGIGDYIDVERSRGYILCKYQSDPGKVFTAPLNIELWYGYQNSLRRNIEVINEVEFR